jgi:Mn-containing catalase
VYTGSRQRGNARAVLQVPELLGRHAKRGRPLSQGHTPDKRGQFEYIAQPKPLTTDAAAELGTVGPRLHGTPKMPVSSSSG